MEFNYVNRLLINMLIFFAKVAFCFFFYTRDHCIMYNPKASNSNKHHFMCKCPGNTTEQRGKYRNLPEAQLIPLASTDTWGVARASSP